MILGEIVEEETFAQAMNVCRVKETLLMWLHRRRYLRKRMAIKIIENNYKSYRLRKEKREAHIAVLDEDRL